jgi:hypothetical protein
MGRHVNQFSFLPFIRSARRQTKRPREGAFLYYPGDNIKACHMGALIEQVDQKPRPVIFHIHFSRRTVFLRYPGNEFRSFKVYITKTKQPDFYACPNEINNKMQYKDAEGTLYRWAGIKE